MVHVIEEITFLSITQLYCITRSYLTNLRTISKNFPGYHTISNFNLGKYILTKEKQLDITGIGNGSLKTHLLKESSHIAFKLLKTTTQTKHSALVLLALK